MQMEMHASTVHWHGNGKVTIYDKVQGSQTSQEYVASAFGLGAKNVRVINTFVGGGFVGGLRPQWQIQVATMAAMHLERSVRVVITRSQMFSHAHRPECTYSIKLGAEADGRLSAVLGDAITSTSRFEQNMEDIVTHDREVTPLGVKGLGEIGIVGVAAAVVNAVYHATGKRVRSLPVTVDKLLAA